MSTPSRCVFFSQFHVRVCEGGAQLQWMRLWVQKGSQPKDPDKLYFDDAHLRVSAIMGGAETSPGIACIGRKATLRQKAHDAPLFVGAVTFCLSTSVLLAFPRCFHPGFVPAGVHLACMGSALPRSFETNGPFATQPSSLRSLKITTISDTITTR